MNQSQDPTFNSSSTRQATEVVSDLVQALAWWSVDCSADSLKDCDSFALSAGEVVYNSGWKESTANVGAGSVDWGTQEAEVQ
ncbi:hypothetical protein BH09CHL1_BH09CHL1_20760 [soil metagenome]